MFDIKTHDAVSTRSRHDSFDITGRWELPKSKDHVAGRLSHDKRGELTLAITTVPSAQSAVFGVCREDESPVVMRATGVLETGEHAVLEGLHPMHANDIVTNFSRISTQTYRVITMLVGHAIPATMQKFEGIRMELVGLLEWMDQLTFKTKFTHSQTSKAVIEYTAPQRFEIMLDDNLTLKIEYLCKIPAHNIPIKNFVMPQSCFVSIYAKTPLSLDELRKNIIKFEYLLMMVTKVYAQPISIKIKMDEEWLGVFGKYVTHNAIHHTDYLKFPLHYTRISKDFKTMVKDWFKFYDIHSKGLDRYFITRLQVSQMSSEIRFLRTVQSLEALDRADHPKPCKLKKRLMRLLEIPYDILEPGTNKEKFATKVAKIRDYHSHGFLEEYEDAILDGLPQLKMNRSLELLLYGYIFQGLSIPECLKKEVMAKEIEHMREFERLNPSPDD